MRRHGVRGFIAKRRSVQMTDSRHPCPIAFNLLGHNFSTISKPNEVWLTDLTYIATGEGWLYMAAIMDLHTRKIVGWSMRGHLRAELATSALIITIQRQRPEAWLVHHYACGDYQAALSQADTTPSMSRRANPLDNASMESFFHTLKTELVHHRTYATRDEASATCSRMWKASTTASAFIRLWTYCTPDQAQRQAENIA